MNTSSPLRLTAGHGFETQGRRCDIANFIIVDAWLPAGVRTPLHVHERAYFTLTLRGGFEERYGSQVLTTTAGTMNFVPAGTPHRTQSHGARLVRMELPDSALALAGGIGPVLQRPTIFTQATTISLARRVAEEVRWRDHGWRLVVQGLLMELLGHAVRDQAVPRKAPVWLREARDRLDSDWRRPVSLIELASTAGVHPVHLARAFRACYRSSVGEYRRARQIEAAEDLLLRSDADLRDVATDCGFADQSHFSKAFRRAFGVSPGRYRRTCSRFYRSQ